jgi:hypothetical protein
VRHEPIGGKVVGREAHIAGGKEVVATALALWFSVALR